MWDSSINNSYSIGKVSGMLNVGGLVGYISSSEVHHSFYDVITSGQSDDDGRGVPKYTYKMFTLTTFTDETWDMVNVESKETNESHIWNIIDGKTYPFLSWEEPREIVWDSIVYPQGIYEPYNPAAPGARLSTFNIKFVNLVILKTINLVYNE